MKILVTGASGFIGSFIVEEALKQGFDTWAAVRRTSSKAYLQDERIHFIELDFDDKSLLTEQLRPHQFDYIVHAAGVTKCKNHDDFYRINTEGTKHLVEAILSLKMPVKKFVYLSSLSVYGPVREDYPHQDILLTDEPQPNTHYAKSKILAEKYLLEKQDVLNTVILRPTGVYGPRERDYFLMVKSIRQHVDFAAGYKHQDITFVYVKDVVQAVFLSLDKQESGRSYFLTDGEVYNSREFSDMIREKLGKPWWIRITAPICLLKTICTVGDRWAKLTGKPSALNKDKFYILSQRNWRCDVKTTMKELGYEPKVKLREGVKLTIEWYKKNGWI